MRGSDRDAVVRRARRGERDAVEQLSVWGDELLEADLRRRSGLAVRRFTSLSDLKQDVLLGVEAILGRLGPRATWTDFAALLRTHAGWAVKNAARKGRRFDGESVQCGVDPGSTPVPATGQVTAADALGWVHERMEDLPPELTAVVRLRLRGDTFAAIAQRLGIGEETARRRFLVAARELRPGSS